MMKFFISLLIFTSFFSKIYSVNFKEWIITASQAYNQRDSNGHYVPQRLVQERCATCKCTETFSYTWHEDGAHCYKEPHDLLKHFIVLGEITADPHQYERIMKKNQLQTLDRIFKEFNLIINNVGDLRDFTIEDFQEALFLIYETIIQLGMPTKYGYHSYVHYWFESEFNERCNKLLIKLALAGNLQAIEILQKSPKIKLSRKQQKQILEILETQGIVL